MSSHPTERPLTGAFFHSAPALRMNHRRAFVFFHAKASQPWGRIFRLALRRPKTGWLAFRRNWVQSWSGSDLFHVVVGDGEVILDPQQTGNRFWPQDEYAAEHPDLVLAFSVPLARGMKLGAFEKVPPAHAPWRVVLKFLTAGRFQTDDCVGMVKRALNAGGVPVPARLYSPMQLKDWLYAQGYPHEILK